MHDQRRFADESSYGPIMTPTTSPFLARHNHRDVLPTRTEHKWLSSIYSSMCSFHETRLQLRFTRRYSYIVFYSGIHLEQMYVCLSLPASILLVYPDSITKASQTVWLTEFFMA